MMGKRTSSQDWLQSIGKDRIQAFQDSFATSFGISLCLLSLDGKPLTVWSNYSLFCHYIKKNNKDRCIREGHKVREKVLRTGKLYIATCYMGLANFFNPIYSNDKVVAIAYGGAVFYDYEKTKEKNAFNVPVMSEKQIKNVLNLLDDCFILFDRKNNDSNLPTHKISDIKEEGFLQKRLTLREIEIVKLINKGFSNKEIAADLHISDKTVKTHMSNILKKMGMKDRMQIILFCRQNNFY